LGKPERKKERKKDRKKERKKERKKLQPIEGTDIAKLYLRLKNSELPILVAYWHAEYQVLLFVMNLNLNILLFKIIFESRPQCWISCVLKMYCYLPKVSCK
jgi:hypothetical protein